jgi:hypothetical protein
MIYQAGFCYTAERKRDGSVKVRAVGTYFRAAVVAAFGATALAVAGCSGFGGPKGQDAAVAAIDPNVYPANYRIQIAQFLRQSLTDRVEFRGALIAQPALKPIGDSQHYMVCVRFNGRSQLRNKVAIYLAGQIAQFIDSTPEQCADAAYQPFTELAAAVPAP